MLIVLSLWLVSVAPVQDTVLVEADNNPIWGEMRLEEQAIIDSFSMAKDASIGYIAAVALGPDGTVYIAGVRGPIRRYTLDGTYIGEMGRRGSNPGRYQRVAGMEVLPDGRLAVWDPNSLRVSIFDPEGSLFDSFSVPSGSSSDAFAIDLHGRVYVRSPIRYGPDPEYPQYGWLRFNPGGELADTLPIPHEKSTASYVVATEDGFRGPFPTKTVSTVGPNGDLVWGRTDEYAIFRALPDGRVLRIQRPYTPVLVTAAEREQWEQYNSQFRSLADQMGREFQETSIPKMKPPFRTLFTDDDGRIWVSIYTEAYEAELTPEYLAEREGRAVYRWREPPVWEVLSSDGRFLGRVSLPPGSFPVASQGDLVVSVRRAHSEQPFVVIYEIVNRDMN